MSDSYQQGLKKDREKSAEYFKKSIIKTEQQKFLETLLAKHDHSKEYQIADVACGGGTLTFHLGQLFVNSKFTLIDYLDDALVIAKDLNKHRQSNLYFRDDIYQLESQKDQQFDFVFCWQTLSWLNKPQKALEELIRITKPGGSLYLSSLFNIDHDVDIYSNVVDLTRDSGSNQIPFQYNTYSEKTVRQWVGSAARDIKFHRFYPQVDFVYQGRGIGTFTVNAENKRLQISGGLLMNWAILQIDK